MKYSLTIHFIISYFLFTLIPIQKPFYYMKKKRVKTKTPLIYSMISGNKTSLNKQTKKKIQELGSLHILTPSGLHFSVVTALILRFVKKKKIKVLILVLSLIVILLNSGMHSIRRIALYSILRHKFEQKGSFFTTFTIDIILGYYHQSPTSWTLSYLFFGVILFSKEKIYLPLYLFIAQSLTSIFFKMPLYLFSLFTNAILTFLFSTTFPFILITYIFQVKKIVLALESGITLFIHFLYQFLWISPKFYIDIPILLLFFLCIQRSKKKNILLLFSLFYSLPLNYEYSKLKVPRYKEYIKNKWSHSSAG